MGKGRWYSYVFSEPSDFLRKYMNGISAFQMCLEQKSLELHSFCALLTIKLVDLGHQAQSLAKLGTWNYFARAKDVSGLKLRLVL